MHIIMYYDYFTRTYCYIFKLCASIDFPRLYIILYYMHFTFETE